MHLAELGENRALQLYIRVLVAMTGAKSDGSLNLERDVDFESHRMIADAIVLGDVELARVRMRSHLRDLRTDQSPVLAEQPATSIP